MVLFCFVDFVGATLRNCADFFVHRVLFDFVFANGEEGAESYMKRDEIALNSSVCEIVDFFQKAFSKVQTRCGAGDASDFFGINVLIAEGIFLRVAPFYVGGEGDVTIQIEPVFGNRSGESERAKLGFSVFGKVNERGDGSVGKFVAVSGFLFSRCARHREPNCAVLFALNAEGF